MFYFNERKYNFWDIYNCIYKFYPAGIPNEIDSFYDSYPGIAERRKRIAESIYDNTFYKQTWAIFYEDISNVTSQKIIGTTTGITSCYSAYVELKREVGVDLIRTKELHFFVSVLGSFYTIIGVDKNEIHIEGKLYSSTNFLIVSPEAEYEELFIYIGKRIEERFEKYRFVPFFICKQLIEGLKLEYKENNCTVFHAIFNNSLDLNATVIGKEHYNNNQWSIDEQEEVGKWSIKNKL